MSFLSVLIAKEKARNKNMIAEYMRELVTLPKGNLKPKNVNGNIYYYLVFRDRNKVVCKYIGKDGESVAALREQLLRRKQVEEIIKKLTEEKTQIKKIEAML